MKRPLLMLTALLALFLFASCGGSNPASSTTPSQSAPGTTSGTAQGYLCNNPCNQKTQIIYVQWTESNGQFTGSWNATAWQNNTITYSNLPITGTHDSSSGSVNFIVDLNGTETPISGTVQGNTLSLQMQQNGITSNLTFQAANNLSYQTAFTSFQQKYQSS